MTTQTAYAAFQTELDATQGAPDWVQLFPKGPEINARDGRRWRLSDPSRILAAFAAYNGKLPTDDYWIKQQGLFQHFGDGYAKEVQDLVPQMQPGDYHFTVDGLMAHGERQKATVHHEYGHVVHKLTKDMGTEIQNFLDEEEPLKKGWGLLVSEYAGSEPDELVAESFGLYMQGEAQHYRLHPRLLEIFKKYDGKYAG